MANNWKPVLTTKGQALLAKLTSGHSFTITRVMSGAGSVPEEDLYAQVAVSNERDALLAKPVVYPKDGQAIIPVVLTNDNVQTSYIARQIGLYAQDPDEGEILYLLLQCDQTGSWQGVDVPTAIDAPGFECGWDIRLSYGQADNVTLLLNPAGTISRDEADALYASKIEVNALQNELQSHVQEFQTHQTDPDAHKEILAPIQQQLADHTDILTYHMEDHNNPHKVTAAQTGAVDLGTYQEHLTDPNAHIEILSPINAKLAEHESKIKRMEDALYNDITGNPHSFLFDSLDGIKVVSGVWNKAKSRLEC